jgi:hypothetical protein
LELGSKNNNLAVWALLSSEYPEISGTKAINFRFLKNFGGVAMAM